MAGQFNFIKVEKVTLRNFTLYKKQGKVLEINEQINSGVYCLAGANGLGKTTFLNAINYGLTGIVLEPDKEVYSPSEIYKYNHDYTERYFKGRIIKKDENVSEIEILFKVNEKYFRIVRGFFDPEYLKALEIYSIKDGKKSSFIKTKLSSPKELNSFYQQSLSTEIGFTSFDYFIFFQLYILTFDENRRMLFWDDRASAHALSIAFNTDPEDTNKILELTRKIEKHGSNARNLKWDSTQAKKKAEELLQKTKGKKTSDIQKLEIEYNKLHKELEKNEKVFNNIRIEFDTMLQRQSHLNSEIMHLKIEHTRLFSRYSKPRSKMLENINVQLSIKNKECCLCGSEGNQIVENIEKNIYKDKCPLCSTIINENASAEQNKLLKLIQENDKKISSANSDLEHLIHEIEGKKMEFDKSEVLLNSIRKKIEDITEDNPDISFKGTGDRDIDSLIDQYLKQSKIAANDAKDEYAKRDKLKSKYEKILKKIENAYKIAKTEFVPIFKKLAKSFIGVDLNIRLERGKKGLLFVLELKDTARTTSSQLSESQRFFLDIALRMAIAVFLSDKKNGATLMVDTPEGSLDIAYESRVGNMFAEYVTEYSQNLLMTANINASQLLIVLAERCGDKKMKFRRMLEWTDPTEIQKDGEHLFKKVYKNIDAALQKRK